MKTEFKVFEQKYVFGFSKFDTSPFFLLLDISINEDGSFIGYYSPDYDSKNEKIKNYKSIL